ncbi:ATP-binding protein [Sphaerisporangium sp. NPDC051017]|uniref:ATP-binding protein n=1 Tax=Sphaerisporangium sp. NPDC051017 TaxID=3154636 RepID=UPI0034402BBC
MDLTEPVWCVWYGVGARHFYAVATWTAPKPLLVKARTTDELRDLMREAERPAPPSPPQSPHSPGATVARADDDARTVSWDLPQDPAMVGKTRSMMHDVLRLWALHALADDVVLAAAELLANAISHGEPPVRVSLRDEGGELVIEVADHGPGLPRRLDLGAEAVHGRGLTIVDALADRSGVIPFPESPGQDRLGSLGSAPPL